MATSNRLFVYGTLRRGFSLHGLLKRPGVRFEGKGRIRARLFDLGEYPGAVPSQRPADTVTGEIYHLSSPARQFVELDAIEEYDPRRPSTSLFRRRLIEVDTENGSKIKAWAYFLNKNLRKSTPIPHGNYAVGRRKRASASQPST
jgi:pyruvate carboxylase